MSQGLFVILSPYLQSGTHKALTYPLDDISDLSLITNYTGSLAVHTPTI